VSIAVDVLQKGAVEFLEKPIKGQDLLDRVQKSLDLDAKQRTRKRSREEKVRVLERLTPRERQVVDLILEGHSSKRIAYKLSVSSQAIDARRANAMRKLGVTSMAELVTFVLSQRGDSESS
jgi:FixJ family two-component response regulator